MISAMPAVAVRRGRKKSKTFGRFNQPPSHHSSSSSLAGRTRSFTRRPGGQRVSTISAQYGGGARAFRHGGRFDTELDRQRRRFLIYTGTLFLISGLLLVFIGVGASVPTAQTVGLLLIGVGAVLCIIKVFCSEAHATDVPTKIIVTDVDGQSSPYRGSNAAAATATPLVEVSEFTELAVTDATDNGGTEGVATDAEGTDGHPNSVQTTTSPLNSIPETQVLIENESGARC